MKRKIPSDAFDAFFALGSLRSYSTLAKKYGVSRRAVAFRAKEEGWEKRIAELEAKAREAADKKKVQTLEATKEQHLQALRLVLGRGIEALRTLRITTPMDAVRAVGLAVREIRVELGEPSDRTAVSIEDTIKREYARWMTNGDTKSTEGDDDERGDAVVQ